tara:strand:- start:1523 stop:1654 length:132 start_codon:yes stop_codon:yes gene_type:complete
MPMMCPSCGKKAMVLAEHGYDKKKGVMTCKECGHKEVFGMRNY